MRIPDAHRRHHREPGHGLPVGRHRRHRRRARVGLGEPVVAGGDRETGRHPLHVVLKRPRQGLVKVVQVEQQPPFRRGEHAEIRQVSIAAQLDIQARHRGVLQVRGHDLGRAPVKGERRDHHPAVADRHQVRLPGEVLRLQQGNRVRAIGRRPPPRMNQHGRPHPGLLAHGLPRADIQMLDCLHGHRGHLLFGHSFYRAARGGQAHHPRRGDARSERTPGGLSAAGGAALGVQPADAEHAPRPPGR